MAVILPSVYKDGTATVAANGVAVTGQGTMWLNTVLPGDFFGTHKGAPNRILAVNSNTSLTLAYPWLGGAQAAAAYEIMYQSDNARMVEASRQLLEKLLGGNVEAFSGLAGVADRVPMFTGPGAMSLLPAGSKGKQLLAAADLLTALTRLGPAGGIPPSPGSAEVGMSDGDFNTVTYPGDYTIAGSWTNGPYNGGAAGAISAHLEVRIRSGAGNWQTLRHGSRTWERYAATSDGTAWQPWQTIDSPTVGTVSRDANGPTGAIIERGSNANGEYVRYADGTQLCWGTGIVSCAAAGNNQFGATSGSVVTGNASIIFPVAFANANYSVANQPTFRGFTVLGAYAKSNSGCTIRMGVSGVTTADNPYEWTAVGRWF